MIEKVLDSETVLAVNVMEMLKAFCLSLNLKESAGRGFYLKKIHMYHLVGQEIRAMSETNNDF